MDLPQVLLERHRRRLVHAPGHGVQNGLGCQAIAAWAAHRNDERPAKLGDVGLVQGLQLGRLRWRALPQARHLLLLFGFAGEVRVGFGRQQGVGLDERHLLRRVGLHDAVRQGPFQVRQTAKRALRQSLFGHPGRVFVNPIQPGQGFGRAGLVQPLNAFL